MDPEKGTFRMQSSHTLDRLAVTFDDDRAVADAGLVLAASISERVGLVEAADSAVSTGARPGRKLATLVHGMVAGASCIDDLDILRAGSTGQVLAHKVMAPSTVGTWLRSLTFGHVRQLDKVAEQLLTRAWQLGAGPAGGELTFDIDSTICPVCGHAKQGAAYGYTRELGYHPLVASADGSGEVLHTRMRKGSAGSGRGAERFVREVAGRVRRAAAAAGIDELKLAMRADSAFWSKKVRKACREHDVRFSLTVRRTRTVVRAIDGIPDDAWTRIDYSDGIAEVAETKLGKDRLIVRRVRNHNKRSQLFDTWRHHAFVTDIQGRDKIDLDAWHRKHAVVELAIRDLKEGAGLEHVPSGQFNANGGWLVACTIAHNLIRWVARLGLRSTTLTVAKTIRRRLLTIPGRITRSARRLTLHLPTDWPWADQFQLALARIRALPKPC